jgi:hypothetical protein
MALSPTLTALWVALTRMPCDDKYFVSTAWISCLPHRVCRLPFTTSTLFSAPSHSKLLESTAEPHQFQKTRLHILASEEPFTVSRRQKCMKSCGRGVPTFFRSRDSTFLLSLGAAWLRQWLWQRHGATPSHHRASHAGRSRRCSICARAPARSCRLRCIGSDSTGSLKFIEPVLVFDCALCICAVQYLML